jgi:hypothetical protein
MTAHDRRTVLAGASAALLATASHANTLPGGDKGAETCLRYVTLSDRYQTLSDEWPILESWLCRKHPNFIGMSAEEQARIPQTARFAEIDRERDDVYRQAEAFLPRVLKVRSRTPEAMIARLMVIERLIVPDEHEEASALIRAALADLGRHFSVPTWLWTTPWPNTNGPGTSCYEPS